MIQFIQATRTASKLRMALVGPTKAGKSFTGLRLLFSLCKRIAVIQSEPGKIQLYEGEAPDGIPWKFQVCELPTHSPESYIEAILLAGKMGFDGILVDSLSHEWMGQGGMLEMVDKKAGTGNDANKFAAWNGPTQIHTRLKEAIARSPAHVICTLRAQMEYIMELTTNRAGKEVMAPKKVGLKPVTGKDFEYEFDLLGTINSDHVMTVEGRCSAVDGEIVVKPGPKFMDPVIEWLTKGVAAPAEYFAVNDEDLKALAVAEASARSPEQVAADAAEARKAAMAKQREALAGKVETPKVAETVKPVDPPKVEAPVVQPTAAVTAPTTTTTPQAATVAVAVNLNDAVSEVEVRAADPITDYTKSHIVALFKSLAMPMPELTRMIKQYGVAKTKLSELTEFDARNIHEQLHATWWSAQPKDADVAAPVKEVGGELPEAKAVVAEVVKPVDPPKVETVKPTPMSAAVLARLVRTVQAKPAAIFTLDEQKKYLASKGVMQFAALSESDALALILDLEGKTAAAKSVA